MEKGHLYSWFQTTFDVPTVDYEATVYVNGQKVGFHRGGYFEFTFDVTDYLNTADVSMNGSVTNEL
jgi:beta-galactosidase/beta-glucuronidase